MKKTIIFIIVFFIALTATSAIAKNRTLIVTPLGCAQNATAHKTGAFAIFCHCPQLKKNIFAFSAYSNPITHAKAGALIKAAINDKKPITIIGDFKAAGFRLTYIQALGSMIQFNQ